MRQTIGIAALVLLAVVVVTFASRGGDDTKTVTVTTRSSSSSSSSSRPGSASVYAEISSTSDCSQLQEMFDTAADNHDVQSAEHDLTMMRVASSYMTAADDRMRDVGCY